MGKELYSCKIEIFKNDINKLLSIFGNNNQYKKYIKDISSNYELLFYEDYFMYASDEEIKYSYDDFTEVIETDTDFYLTNDNVVIYLPKRDMDYKFIGFIRKSFSNIDNRIGEDIGIKEIGKFHDSKIMTKVLLILFIINIVSVFLAFGTWGLVVKYLNIDGLLINTYRWVALFYLPIPIVTTILGWIYYKRGHSSLKNVIGGAIVFFTILGFGVSAFKENRILLEFQKEMGYLNNYKDIIQIPGLPKDGVLYYIEDTECYVSESGNVPCSQLMTIFEDYEKFEKYLFESKYWLLDKDVPSEFSLFIMDNDLKSYYSIYNQTLNEYNKITTEKGIYKYYVMEYVPQLSYLRISEFEYEVK